MNYTVKAVNSSREWESQAGGQMISYKLALEGDGKLVGDVELAQKKATPAPTVGQSIDGTIESTNYGPKLKKDFAGGGKSFGGGGGRAKDPSERRSIERQVAFKGAVELVSAIASPRSDFDFTKMALTEFFNHGLHLIQADAAELIEDVFPDATPLQERAPDKPTVVAGNGGKSPHDHAMDEMRELYVAWSGDDPEAAGVWANKLTSMGIKQPTEASDEQIEELITFLKGGA